MKVSIEEVIDTLRQLKVPAETIIKVETELEAKEAELKAEKEASSEPKAKNQFVVVALDPQGNIQGDITALVVQMAEHEDAGTVLDRLHKAVYDSNRAKKRGQPVTNLGDIGSVKRKFTKEHGVHVKTKEPVRVVVSKGPIPTS